MEELLELLGKLGLDAALVRRVLESVCPKYTDAALAVRYNPYILAEIAGIEFERIDAGVRRLGLAPEAPPRVLAAILAVMHRRLVVGHAEMSYRELAQSASELLRVPVEICTDSISELIESRALVAERVPDADVVLALRRPHAAECSIAQSLSRLRSGPPIVTQSRIDTRGLAARAGMQVPPTMQQRAAIAELLRHPVALLIGPPGSGKTTITRMYLRALDEAGLSSALCAPTARAARHLASASARTARTIHQLLGIGGFDSASPSGAQRRAIDAIVCDESSMLGASLAVELFKSIRNGGKLLLVGDPDQIESIEWGNVLSDLISSGVIPTVRLTELHRTGAGSGIALAARDVLLGRIPTDAEDFSFVEISCAERVADYVVQQALGRMHDLRSLEAVQVLTPFRRRGPLSAHSLNRAIQLQLFKGPADLRVGRCDFFIGDKVMQTENNYPVGIINGDVGTVVDADSQQQALIVSFRGREVRISRASLAALDPAYCMTVHKSQGGQFREVIMPVHSSQAFMLRRNVLYTGMTRAMRRLVLVGDRRGMELAISSDRLTRRQTGLARYLRQLADPGTTAQAQPQRVAGAPAMSVRR